MSEADIPASVAPLSVRQDVASECNPPLNFTSVEVEWVSESGQPSVTEFEADYGKAVPLQENFLTYRCKVDATWSSTEGSLWTTKAQAYTESDPTTLHNLSIAGDIRDLSFVGETSNGYKVSTPIKFNGPALTQDDTLYVKTWTRGTLMKHSSIYTYNGSHTFYICAQTSSDTTLVYASGLHDFQPKPPYCLETTGITSVKVHITPNGTLSLSCTAGGQATISMPSSQVQRPGYVDVIDSKGTTHSYIATRHQVPYTFDISAYSSWQRVKVQLYLYDHFTGGYVHITTQDQSVGPCAALTCGDFQIEPPSVDPDTKFSITVSVHTTTSGAPPGANKMALQILPVAPATWSYTADSNNLSFTSGKVTSQFAGIGPSNQTGQFEVDWIYTNSSNPTLNKSCGFNYGDSNSDFRIASDPYFYINGGDTQAGNNFATDPTKPDSCSETADASIVGWNQDSAGAFTGAGTDYAAYAIGVIDYFATEKQQSSEHPSGLAFSNTYTTAQSGVDGTYGGNFGSYGSCIPDYYDAKPASMDGSFNGGNISSLGSSGKTSSYSASGDVTINGGNVNPGERIVLYVNGDVQINGDINYSGNMNPDKPTYFEVVARGNIYIAAGVSQLDGVYIAQGNGASSNGTLYTCTTSSFTEIPLDGSLNSACNKPLTINGAVVANNIELLRSYGSIGKSNEAAETINYNPSVWIAGSMLSSGTPSFDYDSITSLPPVL